MVETTDEYGVWEEIDGKYCKVRVLKTPTQKFHDDRLTLKPEPVSEVKKLKDKLRSQGIQVD